jgi:hypothetical protein
MLVIKLRFRISRANTTKPQQLRCYAVERFNEEDSTTASKPAALSLEHKSKRERSDKKHRAM